METIDTMRIVPALLGTKYVLQHVELWNWIWLNWGTIIMIRYIPAAVIAASVLFGTTQAHALCAGLAVASDGAWGAAWRARTCDEARRLAVQNCLSRTSQPCYNASTMWNGWVVGMQCQNRRQSDGTMSTGVTLDEARANAYRYVRSIGYDTRDCRIVQEVASEIGPTR